MPQNAIQVCPANFLLPQPEMTEHLISGGDGQLEISELREVLETVLPKKKSFKVLRCSACSRDRTEKDTVKRPENPQARS
jgi:hypothetical protein